MTNKSGLFAVCQLKTEAQYLKRTSYVNPCVKMCMLETYATPSPPLSSWMVCSGLPAGRCVHLTRERKTQPDTAREHSGLQHSPFRCASQQWFQPGTETERKRRENDRKKLNYHKVSHKVQCRGKEKGKKWKRGPEWSNHELYKSRKHTHTCSA